MMKKLKEQLINKNFGLLYLSSIISSTGNQLSIVAFPLIAIYIFNANEFQVSIVTAMIFLPNFIFSSHIGVLIDKHRKKPILVLSNLACFVLLTVMYAFINHIHLYTFYFLIFLVSTVMIFTGLTFFSYVPQIVTKNQIKQANYNLEISGSIIQSIGPSLAGKIVDLISMSLLILLDAITFLLSGIFQIFIKDNEKSISDKKIQYHFTKEILNSYKYILNHEMLKSLLIGYAVIVISIGMFSAVQIYYLSEYLQFTPLQIGIFLSLGNIGMVCSAIFSGKISNKLGSGKTISLSLLSYSIGFLLYALSNKEIIYLALLGQLLISFALPLYNVNALTLRQQVIPISELGKTTAMWKIVGRGLIPIGASVAGGIAFISSINVVMYLSFAIGLISCYVILRNKKLYNYMEG